MAKTNKELAVELYSASLIASGNLMSNPNFKGTVKIPSCDEMAKQIKKLISELSTIQDN